MEYNWQLPDWGKFEFDERLVTDKLIEFAEHSGRVSGIMSALPDDVQTDTIIDMMVAEALKTSAIESEYLSRADIMSSIRNNLGLMPPERHVKDQRAKGIAALMVSIRNTYSEPLNKEMLFDWHEKLMLGQRFGAIGAWRTHKEPMQVVSGPIGKEIVHYEAPPSSEVPEMMGRFIDWFNASGPDGQSEIKSGPIRAAIAHLYFETIHPFEDGNGRIGRAISEKALSQTLGRPVILSLSKAIEANKAAYYEALKQAQRTNVLNDWLIYFIDVCLAAQKNAEAQIQFTLEKAKFLDRVKSRLNDRQLKVIIRMLDEGPEGFTHGMSAKKYVSITGISKPTATRDLQELARTGVLIPIGSGRSTRYQIPFIFRDDR